MSLSPEDVEKAAKQVLTQLSERLTFSNQNILFDEEMECLQFGICIIPTDSKR